MTRFALLSAAVCMLASTSAVHAQTFSYTTLDNPADPTFNQLLGINDSGVIAGYYGSGAAGHPNIGYTIAPPYTTFVSDMMPTSTQTQATGINNSGLVTGFWAPTNTGSDANFGLLRQAVGSKFAYLSVTDPLVAGLPQVDQALGINNSNVVAGFYNDAGGKSHGFTYDVTTAAYTALKIKGATAVAATGINDNNQICGFYVAANGVTFGFVEDANGGVVTRFRVGKRITTQLLGINNSGIAVGFYAGGNGVPYGLYYTSANGNWSKVDDPNGAMGTVVNGINNENQLVGFYIDAAGNTHGMLVTVQ